MFEHLDDPEPFQPDAAWWAATERRGRRRRRTRRLRAGAFTTLAFVVSAVLIGGAWTRQRLDGIDRLDVAVPGPTTGTTSDAGGLETILAIGTDRDLGGAGTRSDSIAVVRVDRSSNRVQILAVPRDLVLFDREGTAWSRRKVSEIFELRGPQGVVDALVTIGVAVDHVVVLSPEGLRRLVDAAGGVGIRFDQPMRDDDAGLLVDTPGCHALDGDRALALARSRHLRVLGPDGQWYEDPTGDFGRMARNRLLGQVLAATLVDLPPTRLPAVIDAAGEGLSLDRGWSPGDLVDLAAWARGGASTRTVDISVLGHATGLSGQASVVWGDTDEDLRVLEQFGRVAGAQNPPGPSDPAATPASPNPDAQAGTAIQISACS